MVEINWAKVLSSVLGGKDDSVIDVSAKPTATNNEQTPPKTVDLMGAVHKISTVAMDKGLHDAIKSVRVSLFGDGTKTVEAETEHESASSRRTLAYSLKELAPNNEVVQTHANGRIVLWVMVGTAKENFSMRIGEDFVEVDAKALTYNPDDLKDEGSKLVGSPFDAASIVIKLPCKVFKTPVATSYTNGVACVVLHRLEPAKVVDDTVVFD
jgi:HSP20 family molecular chaperone IbpA